MSSKMMIFGKSNPSIAFEKMVIFGLIFIFIFVVNLNSAACTHATSIYTSIPTPTPHPLLLPAPSHATTTVAPMFSCPMNDDA
jgi:hypothetical protein